VHGITGSFTGKGDIDHEKGTCRPTYKPTNWLWSLLGREKAYPTDLPAQNLIRCDIASVRHPGQFRTIWVALPSVDMDGIVMKQTVFGQLSTNMMDGIEAVKKQMAKVRLDGHVARRESEILKAKAIQTQTRTNRLTCSQCDKTYTQEEANQRDNICDCGAQINLPR